ncbi:excinuclease ABC subunit UvrB [Candidatus Parcubacteria bacterium]|nr:MAG: excinuclease ABC subunit UvrB [Candidatus Parcubacteria bacterium]
MQFNLKSQYRPTGDQPKAIEKLVANFDAGAQYQTLLGVTGSGKTFTMANVIARLQKPTLVISHNKTLAAQLYQEFKEFFPDSAIHYFVSYYDYYQPEAYMPASDTFIEKDAKINDLIDALRHGATASLLTRDDVIIVASVSCIYGIGDPEAYEQVAIPLKVGEPLKLRELFSRLTVLQYRRNALDPRQGEYRARENSVEIFLPAGDDKLAIDATGGRIASLALMRTDRQDAAHMRPVPAFKVFPAKHFVTPQAKLKVALANIRSELAAQLERFRKEGKPLEAERLEQRTNFDLEMLEHTGTTNGIENYSRHLSFREPGSAPFTLVDYFRHRFGDNFLTVIDESHATVPQLRGMEAGDRARKETLVEYGFRLPSAIDNRPLKWAEFSEKIRATAFVSATPSAYELAKSKPYVVEQLIRPTGVLDPNIEVRPTARQVRDVIAEVQKRAAKGERSLVMALTKRLAEDIADYLTEAGLKAEYIHSEVKTLDRPDIIKRLRQGEHDVLVGINLLREGLDIPEVSFIAILDADKEGFLRNETTLLQIIGRAARHTDGTVILYADSITDSMRRAMDETARRRAVQEQHNRAQGITPQAIQKAVRKSLLEELAPPDEAEAFLPAGPTREIVANLEREMKRAAKEMNFELAAKIRDRIRKYRSR